MLFGSLVRANQWSGTSCRRSRAVEAATPFSFLCGFYLLLVGSKVLIVLLAARSRDLLVGRPYRVVMRVLAVLLAFFAFLLFREGWKHLVAA
jgi:hypothetical protein